MILDDEATKSLTDFLLSELQSINEPDPNGVTEYVLALLRHNKSLEDLKSLCLSQLEDFLRDETGPFVEQLFKHVETILPGGASNDTASRGVDDHIGPANEAQDLSIAYSDFAEDVSDDDDNDRNFKHTRRRQGKAQVRPSSPVQNLKPAGLPNIPHSFPAPASGAQPVRVSDQKRLRSETSDADYSHAAKLPRMSSRVDSSGVSKPFHDSRHGRERESSSIHTVPHQLPINHAMNLPPWEGAMHWSQPFTNAPINSRTMDRRWNPAGGDHGQNHRRQGSGRTYTCRDYEDRGFCLRGDACPYDHGFDRIVMDDMRMFGGFGFHPRALDASNPGMLRSNGDMAFDGYDPDSSIFPQHNNSERNEVLPQPEQRTQQRSFPNATTETLTRNSADFGRRGSGRGRGRGGFQQSIIPRGSTLCVQSIPKEFLSIPKVHEFFKHFGDIADIRIDFPAAKAYVQFSNQQAAQAAYRSPHPIFDNRFVRVFWANAENQTASNSLSSNPVGEPTAISEATEDAKTSDFRSPLTQSEPKIDKAKNVMEMQRLLIERQLEEQKKIMEKLQIKTLTDKEKKTLMKQFEILSKSLKDVMSAASSSVKPKVLVGQDIKPTPVESKERARLDRELDELHHSPSGAVVNLSPQQAEKSLIAELEKLKAKAAQHGIDPAAVLTSPAGRGNSSTIRGRGRSRPWRGGRDNNRYTLDNRPTSLRIEKLGPRSFDLLQPHFEKFGTVSSVAKYENEGHALVTYASRRDAEKAFGEPITIEDAEKAEVSWSLPRADAEEIAQVAQEHEDSPADNQKRPDSGEDDESDAKETSWKRS
ncbi:hypothetical protein DFS34DRAFT_218663 [Phlyctochytrium arcticum]|nr:hypothetical protein DFS34DRAFT_218663 [Phlyctochytrium arcticum]